VTVVVAAKAAEGAQEPVQERGEREQQQQRGRQPRAGGWGRGVEVRTAGK